MELLEVSQLKLEGQSKNLGSLVVSIKEVEMRYITSICVSKKISMHCPIVASHLLEQCKYVRRPCSPCSPCSHIYVLNYVDVVKKILQLCFCPVSLGMTFWYQSPRLYHTGHYESTNVYTVVSYLNTILQGEIGLLGNQFIMNTIT